MAHVDLYDETANIYDVFELSGQSTTPITNTLIVNLLRRAEVRRVLDMTCGTGAQTIGLFKAGFEVIGSDLSRGMLDIARQKSEGCSISYFEADMRTVSLGKFDAIISMYNAVGHLTKDDFRATMKNTYQNLGDGGVYIFDIFNSAMMHLTPDYEFIDAVREVGDAKYVRFSRSAYDGGTGLLNIRQRMLTQRGREKPREVPDDYTLQTYNADELQEMLEQAGFVDVQITGEGMLDVFRMPNLVHFVSARKPPVGAAAALAA
jgi:SAM-dependent methyltransferase